MEYRLSYPNREVRRAPPACWIAPQWRRSAQGGAALRRLLAACDWAALESLLRAELAGIPHDWHRRRSPTTRATGRARHLSTYPWRTHEPGAAGMGRHVYLVKMAQRAGRGGALAQMKYADKYRIVRST